MSRHSLKVVIVMVACAAIANPVLAGLNDSRVAAMFGAGSSAADGACSGPTYAAARERNDG